MRVFDKMRRVIAAYAATLLFAAGACAVALLIADAVWPEASGDDVKTKGEFTIDCSDVGNGYFMAKREACSSGLKLRVSKGGAVYTYDLNRSGRYEVFPLQLGEGTYKCTLYRNVKGNKYAKDAEITLDVDLNDKYAPYLVPNQYVDYELESLAVQKSLELCEGMETDVEKFDAIKTYIVDNFKYDYERARSNPGAYLGDVEGCFETKLGLCQDLSVVAAAMLRVQGIPTQLVIGYADKNYHAWNNVLIDEEYRRLDISALLSGVEEFGVYTEERYY